MKRHFRPLLLAFIAIGFVSLFQAPARAEIRDEADFLSPAAEAKVSQLIREIQEKHGKNVIVETVPAMPDAPAESAARLDFYEAEVARRGKEANVDGVYILISRQPTYLYVGVDPKTQQGAFTLADRGAVKETLLKRFEARDYDGGLVAGLEMLRDKLAANASPAAAAAPVQAKPNSGKGSSTGWILLIGGAVVLFLILRGISARRRLGQGYPGQPGYGQPGYGQPGYGQPGVGGGGMGRGLVGGLLGGLAGGYLYDRMTSGGSNANAAPLDPTGDPTGQSLDTTGGGDWGGGNDFSGGGDFGGGGDWGGGGDFGGE